MTKPKQRRVANDPDRPAAVSTAAIRVDGLRVTYADGTTAVRDVSLTVPRGEFFGFLGPNGAGKTTAVKVLVTLLEPTEGEVVVNGHDATAAQTAVRETIGYMAQDVSVDAELTARENVAFACEAYGVPRGRRAERIEELLELADLGDVADTPAERFSGGMKKRLDAVTALVHDPDLVFLDEPTTGMDPKARNRLWDHFRRLNETGTTIFLTTQYLEEADALCDRVAVLRDGRIAATGSPAELKRRVGGQILEVDVDGGRETAEAAADVAREGTRFGPDATVETVDDTVRVTTTDAAERGTDYLLALREAGVAVTGFDVDEPTLDDVFFAIADGRTDGFDAGDDGETGPGPSGGTR
ncbi:daunorubicin ABC transporter ATPase [Haloarcula sp. CBA1115]|uniref:ABC transporter ATP-binding protein n=1 Tax=unclassified Haloarcula TaxID=2624677 RepID=UPI00059553C0|nr:MULTISPECIES: ABC transporter ATP-binding protein [unclassified Haloarcula]AJF24950.1 daunorubicin ABC transporter ATPase [Haloarcula sp. CBA1115]